MQIVSCNYLVLGLEYAYGGIYLSKEFCAGSVIVVFACNLLSSVKRIVVFFLLFFSVLCWANSGYAAWYVTPSGAGDQSGSNWSNAMNGKKFSLKLHKDFFDMVHNDPFSTGVYYLAKGVYKGYVMTGYPSHNYPPYEIIPGPLCMIKGTEIYGGFAGNEIGDHGEMLAARDIEKNKTVFTGDYYGQDINKIDGITTSADYVVVSKDERTHKRMIEVYTAEKYPVESGDVVVDGVTVTGAGIGFSGYGKNALIRNCTFIGNVSMGIYFSSSIVQNCKFINNSGSYGAAINGDGVITDCEFIGNRADMGGGGIYFYSTIGAVVKNCLFKDNAGGGYEGGSGIACVLAKSTDIINCQFINNKNNGITNMAIDGQNIKDCVFIGNDGGGVANTIGSGICNSYSSNCVITNCTFTENIACGANFSYVNSLTVTGCKFTKTKGLSDGTYDNLGSGLTLFNATKPSVKNCVFSENDGPGMMARGITGSVGSVANCFFEKNLDSGLSLSGSYASSHYTVSGCTFAANKKSYDGGGLNIDGSASAVVTNCTFYENEGVRGGAIFDGRGWNSKGLWILNCTLSRNKARDTSSGLHNAFESNKTSGAVVANCIFWNTKGKNSEGRDIEEMGGGYCKSLSYSVISADKMPKGWYDKEVVGNTNADPKLRSLAANGGYTKTCAIPNDSSAIGNGTEIIPADLSEGSDSDLVTVPSLDQRGVARVMPPDIGAYEYEGKILVRGVSLDRQSLSVYMGKPDVALTAQVTPSNATNKNIIWTSSSTDIATIDQSGNVHAVSPGAATITVMTQSGRFTATCDLEVKTYTEVTGVTLDPTAKTVKIGETFKIIATVTPDNATDKRLNWTTDNAAVATVSNGVVTAKTAGNAKITATAEDGSGKSATCTVTVGNSLPTDQPNFPPYAEVVSQLPSESVVAFELKDGKAYISSDIAEKAQNEVFAKYPDLKDKADGVVKSLPVLNVDVTSGDFAFIALPMTMDIFDGIADTKDFKLIKILPNGSGDVFELSKSIGCLKDKTYIVLDTANNPYEGAVADRKSYRALLCIEDGGSFDIDGKKNGVVLDPVGVLKLKSSTPTPTTDGGSSGCNGGFMALALLGIVPIIACRKK